MIRQVVRQATVHEPQTARVLPAPLPGSRRLRGRLCLQILDRCHKRLGVVLVERCGRRCITATARAQLDGREPRKKGIDLLARLPCVPWQEVRAFLGRRVSRGWLRLWRLCDGLGRRCHIGLAHVHDDIVHTTAIKWIGLIGGADRVAPPLLPLLHHDKVVDPLEQRRHDRALRNRCQHRGNVRCQRAGGSARALPDDRRQHFLRGALCRHAVLKCAAVGPRRDPRTNVAASQLEGRDFVPVVATAHERRAFDAWCLLHDGDFCLAVWAPHAPHARHDGDGLQSFVDVRALPHLGPLERLAAEALARLVLGPHAVLLQTRLAVRARPVVGVVRAEQGERPRQKLVRQDECRIKVHDAALHRLVPRLAQQWPQQVVDAVR